MTSAPDPCTVADRGPRAYDLDGDLLCPHCFAADYWLAPDGSAYGLTDDSIAYVVSVIEEVQSGTLCLRCSCDLAIAHRPYRFALGQVVATPGALDLLRAEGINPATLLGRHIRGEWGDLSPNDRALNDEAVAGGGRLLSAYDLASGARVWCITEADRSATTLLLPSEY